MAVRAVIDVGTNSVKLLVAEVTGAGVVPLVERSRQTRLGTGFYEAHRLGARAIEETADAVAEFARKAGGIGARAARVIATSAARDAVNQGELVAAIRQRCGLGVEVISGEQEAEWAFRGVAADPALGEGRLLILDVGGGSSQFILGEGGHHTFRQSFPMGSVRLLEKLRPADPPSIQDLAVCRAWLQDFFNREITPVVESYLYEPGKAAPQLIATGGTSTILARMEKALADFDRAAIEGTVLSRSRILDWMVRLWGISLEARKKIIGLPPNRADIILMGVGIYETMMEHFRFEAVQISTRGMRFGAVMEAM